MSKSKKQKVEQTQTQTMALHEKFKKSIFAKIPVLSGREDVYLPQEYFTRLTDEEFVVLWTLPDLTIQVSEDCAAYIENRRKLLGLERAEGSEVRPSK